MRRVLTLSGGSDITAHTAPAMNEALLFGKKFIYGKSIIGI
jgi:hypothetical protein